MAFTFALFTSDPNLLECELRRLEGQVAFPEGQRLNAAAVGSYAQDQVLLQRFPSGAVPRSLRQLLPKHRSEALLYHAQSLSVGASHEESTQPFRYRHWMFCQSGDIHGYSSFRSRVVSELPGFLRNQLRGELAAEGAFALFLKQVRELGPLDERRLDPKRVAQALIATGRRMQELSSEAGSAHTSEISLVATNQQLFVAARLGDEPLRYTLLEGSDRCEVCGPPPSRTVPAPKLRAHVQRRTVAVASLSEGPGWIDVPAGGALAVDWRFGVETVTP